METTFSIPEAPPSPGDSTCSTNITLLVSLSTIENATKEEEMRNHKVDVLEKIIRLEKEREKPGADHEAIDAELKQCRIKSEEIDMEFLKRGVFHALFSPKAVGGGLKSSFFHDDDLSVITIEDDDKDSRIDQVTLQKIREQREKDEGKKKMMSLRMLSSSDVNREKMTSKGGSRMTMTKKQERLAKRNV